MLIFLYNFHSEHSLLKLKNKKLSSKANVKNKKTSLGQKNYRIISQAICFKNRCGMACFYFYSGKKQMWKLFLKKLCLYGYFIGYYSSQAKKLIGKHLHIK